MFRGIRKRVVANYLLVIAVTVLLMGALFIWFLNYSYLNTLRENLFIQARLTVALVEEMNERGASLDEIDRMCKSLGEELGVRITYIEQDGTVLADSSENPLLMENHGSRPEVVEALSGTRGFKVRYSITLAEEMLYLAVPVKETGLTRDADKRAVIRLALPLVAVNKAVSDLVLYIIAALLLSSLAALGASYFISSGITGPIQKISKASKAIAKGNYYPSLEIRGKDELADLAINIREMGKTLDHKIEQVLREKNKLESVVSSMDSGIIFLDSRLNVELINPAAENLFEVSRNKVLGSPVRNIIRHYALHENLKAACHDGKPRLLEMNLYSPRNALIEAYIRPIPENSIPAVSILLLFHEVTHLRSLEKMRSDFVANVSHELRTPLTTVRGYTETILNEKLSGEQLEEFLIIIERETKRLSSLIDDLLDLSKIENEKAYVKKNKVKLMDLVTEVLERFKNLEEEIKLNIEGDSIDSALEVTGNREWLCQAMVNIIENSIKYGADDGRVTIKIYPEGNKAVIEISDNGPGIPEADLPYVFERFYRVDKGRSRKSGGTGLGLSIVKHIMEAHEAEYSLESKDKMGTLFRFKLPLA